jgi:hypothetical protein
MKARFMSRTTLKTFYFCTHGANHRTRAFQANFACGSKGPETIGCLGLSSYGGRRERRVRYSQFESIPETQLSHCIQDGVAKRINELAAGSRVIASF